MNTLLIQCRKIYKFVLPVVIFLLTTFCYAGEADSTAKKANGPNIILILADDLGFGDLGVYGSVKNQTPYLDQMALKGLKLTNFYAYPVCSPSRAALLTGCNPVRVNVPKVLAPEGPAWTHDRFNRGLNPSELTIAELLKQRNYAAACVGKWHLGDDDRVLPLSQGFDEYFGLPYSNDMTPDNNILWPDLPLLSNQKVVEYNPDQTNLTQRFTEVSLDFIERNKSRPFFLYLAHAMPHVPLSVSRQFAGKSQHGIYSDVITEMDASVGRIMKKLEALNILDNTLIIFTSDNGPWLEFGSHAGSAGPFREGKSTSFEGGVRVPFIAYWERGIKCNSSSHQVSSLEDILPTIAEVTVTKLPERKIDGRSIFPLFRGGRIKDKPFYVFLNGQPQAVRLGPWKLHLPHKYKHVSYQDGERTEVQTLKSDLALYNIQDDPEEQYNLAEMYPEKTVAMRQMILDYNKQLNKEIRPALSW
ncbi:sulfatase [Fulvivirga sp. M361]|uniref:sulfatase family protein n=1 Tax=Fulvivirga sp. M361 TaxID=2594266 RepID=UPI001179A011|nr:sulfatase [Fulvivirga sp. M361]TRX60245.1 sulfatase [Fulvivirga sp. M361]